MSFDTQFLLFLVAVAISFTFLIIFGLRYGNNLRKKNFQMTSTDVWKSIQSHIKDENFDRDNLLYTIYQDESSTEVSFVLRNSKDEELGKTRRPLGNQKASFEIQGQKYIISYPFTWNAQATLHKEGEEIILARYSRTGWFGKHEIEIPGYGTLVSSRVTLDFKSCYKYSFNGKIVGMMEYTINGYANTGRVLILPDDILLPIRLFLLSV